MRAIIVDDEQPSLDLLRLLLERDGRIRLSGAYKKPSEALAALDEAGPDVAFLDVDMPQMNGLELARRIHERQEAVEIVFVTAYAQYAIDAFRRNALDYLLKPLTPEAVSETVSRLYKRRQPPAPLPMPTSQEGMKAVLFGGFDILDTAGQPVKWRTLKTKEMMAYFLAKEGQQVSKWELMADLWPELNEEQSRTYLHTTLYNLKKALKDAGGAGQIHYVSGQYHASFGDVANPLRLYREFERTRPPLTEETARDYQALASLYQGELFARLDYPWSAPYREMCFGLFRQSCIRLSRFFLDKGEQEAAAKAAGQLLVQSEIDEEAHEMMLEVHFLKNDRMALRHQYEQLKHVLLSELGLPPKPAVERLYAGMMDRIGSEGSTQ
ncbi:MAG: hypothetical protein K0Q90_2632 [Paenibacillaceae bacterium]|jgi:two-component SAPR family response regulator|nr:hypothetical protein [Paenibacillaceae bacterium]